MEDPETPAGSAKTFDRALVMLTVRARSTRDLRRRLLLKGEAESDVDMAIARLSASGLLNDLEFARQFARSRFANQRLSACRMRQELFARGVAREVAEAAIADVIQDESIDEAENLERVARAKLRTLGRLDEPTRRRRLYAFLARRGYDSNAIRRVMTRLETADS